jgi:hypothetical protein
MVKAKKHGQLGDSNNYTVCDLHAITLECPENLVQFASGCDLIESHQSFDVSVAIHKPDQFI